LASDAVSVSTGHADYPAEPPFSPGDAYPEYPFGVGTRAKERNSAYEGVRDALRLLGLDAEHHGQRDWNPLGEMVRPGDTVVVKPNLIRDFRETRVGLDDCVITHGAIIRAVLDYVYIALTRVGRIIVADAPQNDADFDAIRRLTGLDEIQEFYRRHAGVEVEVLDLRPQKARKINGVIVGHERLPGDPAGYVKVDLGRHSMFTEVEHLCHLLYGSEYDTSEIRRHHTRGVHEYLVSRTILDADCVINLPKLKTHKKTGITICMKNLVGINGNKNWLPHHREGTLAQGGDQFADDGVKHRIERRLMIGFRYLFPLLGPLQAIVAKPFKAIGQGVFGNTNTATIRSGNWYGNDTAWRMVLDLNRILMYAGRDGHLQDTPARRIFCLVDGIVAGEGNGPLDPTPKAAGVVIAGRNPVAVDFACARLMGFDPTRLPTVKRSFDSHHLPLVSFSDREIVLHSDDGHGCGPAREPGELSVPFLPHFGWLGHCETRKEAGWHADAGAVSAAAQVGDGKWVIDCNAGDDVGVAETTQIVLLGDIVLAGRVGDAIHRQGDEFLFARIPREFFEVDVLCFNLECCLSGRGEVWEPKQVHFRGRPEYLSVFPRAACKYVANVANNHFLDYGEEASLDTLRTLRAFGMECFGAAGTLAPAQHVVVKTRSGAVGLLGFAPSIHSLPDAHRVNLAFHQVSEMVARVRLLKEQTDVVIVSLHQGLEHTRCVQRRCRRLAHRLVAAGADCVVCHHPHVIQGIETYQSVPVFHSIGSFVIDMDFQKRPAARASLALRLLLSGRKLRKILIEPFVITDGLQPRPATGEEGLQIRRETEALSRTFDSRWRTQINHVQCQGVAACDRLGTLGRMMCDEGILSATRYCVDRTMTRWRRRGPS
jgi:uncharacterized protein (DUF362 family)/poly-gamma-glutamate capsule biosynthesis protein CapA/YwtB (metallophosphatase superfamily)